MAVLVLAALLFLSAAASAQHASVNVDTSERPPATVGEHGRRAQLGSIGFVLVSRLSPPAPAPAVTARLTAAARCSRTTSCGSTRSTATSTASSASPFVPLSLLSLSLAAPRRTLSCRGLSRARLHRRALPTFSLDFQGLTSHPCRGYTGQRWWTVPTWSTPTRAATPRCRCAHHNPVPHALFSRALFSRALCLSHSASRCPQPLRLSHSRSPAPSECGGKRPRRCGGVSRRTVPAVCGVKWR